MLRCSTFLALCTLSGCYASHELGAIDAGACSDDAVDARAPRNAGPWLALARRQSDDEAAPWEVLAVRATDRFVLPIAEGRFPSGVWSPAGRRLALARRCAREERLISLEVLTFDDGGVTERSVIEPGVAAFIPSMEWSPDGRHLAYVVETVHEGGRRESGVRVVDATRPGAPLTVSEGAGTNVQIAWSPTSDRLALDALDERGERIVALASVAEGFATRPVALPPEAGEPRVGLELSTGYDLPHHGWSPDGSGLAFLARLETEPPRRPQRLFVASAVEETEAQLVSPRMHPHSMNLFTAYWSPGGAGLLYHDLSPREETPLRLGWYAVAFGAGGASAPVEVGVDPEDARWIGEGRLLVTRLERSASAVSVTVDADGASTEALFTIDRRCTDVTAFAEPLQVLVACTPELRGDPQHLFLWRAGAAPREIGRMPGARFTDRGWALDGSAYVFVTNGSSGRELYEVSLADGSLTRVAEGVDHVRSVRPEAWSADGRFYAVPLWRGTGVAIRDRESDRFDVVVSGDEELSFEVFGFEAVPLR